MPRADLLRSLSAPAELIEADLVDQLADASAALARLRSATPSEPDASWDRAYSRAQSTYLKALASLEKLRKAHPAPQPSPEPTPACLLPAAESRLSEGPAPLDPYDRDHPSPTASFPSSPLPTPTLPGPLNRRERRRLESFKRSAAARSLRRAAASPA